jgi:hypothetical protein
LRDTDLDLPPVPDIAPGARDAQVGAPATREATVANRTPRSYPSPQLEGGAQEAVLNVGDMWDVSHANGSSGAMETMDVFAPLSLSLSPPSAPPPFTLSPLKPAAPSGLQRANSGFYVRASQDRGAGGAGALLTPDDAYRPEPGFQGTIGLGIENRPVRSRSRSGSAFGLAKAVVSSTAGAMAAGSTSAKNAAKSAGTAISQGSVSARKALTKTGGRNSGSSITGRDISSPITHLSVPEDRRTHSQSSFSLYPTLSSMSSTTLDSSVTEVGATRVNALNVSVGSTASGTATVPASAPASRPVHLVHSRTTSSTSSSGSQRLRKMGQSVGQSQKGLFTKLKGEIKVLGGKLGNEKMRIDESGDHLNMSTRTSTNGLSFWSKDD